MKSKRQKKVSLLLTCEHASNRVPAELKSLFRHRKGLLTSHRAWDDGAISIARTLSQSLRAPLIEGQFSRLVIDLNRSLDHRGIFSDLTRALPADIRQGLISRLYAPFRSQVLRQINRFRADSKYVCHFSIHSFVPILNGEIRNCEIGILYDPRRPHEKRLAYLLKKAFQIHFPAVRIRMNYPYRGTADGHTTHLRNSLSDRQYAGIELEFNQAWRPALSKGTQEKIADAIREATQELLPT